jgi:Ricin-type beta-trefoil lectin domain
MRRSRRLVAVLAASALVAGGGIGMGLVLAANAQTQLASCSASGTKQYISCGISNSATLNDPSLVQAVVTLNSGDNATTPDLYVEITYQVFCVQGSSSVTTSNTTDNTLYTFAITTSAPVTDTLTLGYGASDSCQVLQLTANLESSIDGGKTFFPTSTGSFTMDLEWTPEAATSSPSPKAVPLIKGYDDKCLDDKGNSSANRAEVILWTCDGADSAEGWKFTGGELQHNGKCANDRGGGGSGTKVIMWTCNGSSNEKWSHPSSDGEFVLNSTAHGKLCLTDPGHSTANRTQLIVYTCHNTSNQHWT